ncbi:MAG: hypothetical protein KGR98_10625, partial [Verrucomicrobia bacterium]|nr:hypothetical protein [Verrucomicrobiota bacterium]
EPNPANVEPAEAAYEPQPLPPEALPPEETPPAYPPAAAAPSAEESAEAQEEAVEIPLLPLLEKLPGELRARLNARMADLSQGSLSISVSEILPQLPSGAVKITFGQLRQAIPDLFSVGDEYDLLPVGIPLNAILPRLNISLLRRQHEQRTLNVSGEIADPFNTTITGIKRTVIQGKPITPPQPPRRAPIPPPAAPSAPRTNGISASAPSRPVIPSVPPPPVVRRPAVPQWRMAVPPVAPPSPPSMERISPPSFSSPPAEPQSFSRPASAPAAPEPAPVVPKPAPVPPATAQTTPSATAPVPGSDGAAILATLGDLLEKWPETLKGEIVRESMNNMQVAIPMEVIEPALKRGRVIFSWYQLRSWTNMPTRGSSPNNGVELELPLKVIVPLFLERRGPLRSNASGLAMDSVIPNLFFGFPSPEMEATVPAAAPPHSAPQPPQTAPAEPVAPEPAPRPHSATSGAMPGSAGPAADTNFFGADDAPQPAAERDDTDYRGARPGTDFTQRQMTPKDIVAEAMALQGVSGAVIALPDGLKVASEVPPELNADTVAAFLPQIFDRVAQSTRELRMGALNNLKFTVGNVPWRIFRVNAVYFAAMGRAGQRLPGAQLAKLAAALDRKNS